ncbi:hypothetical protein RB596_000194 [Gaeumannomyces avenae]
MDSPLYLFLTVVVMVMSLFAIPHVKEWIARLFVESKENLSSKSKEVPPRRGVGLVQVYPDIEGSDLTEKPTVDIVAIHGLNTGADTTWLAFKNGKDSQSGHVHWLKDKHMLPARIPYSRILTYDWNANIGKDVSADFFHGHAEAFLHQLSRNRKDLSRSECPLIFVASCFGGLLLIKALLRAGNESGSSYESFRPILDSTIAVAFLGTPFTGSSQEAVITAQARVQNSGDLGGDELVRYLAQGGELDGLVRDFTEHIGKPRFRFKLACFYENYPTGNNAQLRGLPEGALEGRLDPRGKALVVGRDSACLKVPGVEHLSLEVRHNMLNKFNSPTDGGYLLVAGMLRDYAEKAKEPPMTNVEKFCLQSLGFPKMTDRLNEIDSAMTGTCQWLLKHDTYKRWAATDRSILWIKGKPGSGKSTLMKFALAHVGSLPNTATDDVVLTFFFHGRGDKLQKTPLGLWQSLLHQLLVCAPRALASLVQAFKQNKETRGEFGEAWQWHQNELQSFFKSALRDVVRARRVLLYVDALDECGEADAIALVHQFNSLLRSLPTTGCRWFHICFSCRQYPFSNNELLEINPAEENGKDVLAYVRNELSQLGAQGQQPTILIANRARGVFMWARIVVKKILDLDRKGEGWGAVEKAIQSIPQELDGLYRTLLQSMEPDSLKLIQWICFSERPLTTDELQWAMAVDPDGTHKSLEECQRSGGFITNDRIDRRIKTLSCGLAEIVPSSDTPVVQFIHQSVKDFFVETGLSVLDSTSMSAIGMAHHRLSKICIRYLATEEIGQLISYKRRVTNRPLLLG